MKLKTKAAGAVALADVDATPRVAPRWGRYALWQLGDYARAAGLGTVVVATAAVALLANSSTSNTAFRQYSVTELLVQIGFFGSVFAVTGLVSSDRTRGWYRFMFAKPASALRYYAQAFALRGLGLLAAMTIMWGLCAIFVAPVSLISTLDATLLQFWLIGSLTFLLSTLIRFEWLGTLVISVISYLIADGAQRANAPWWNTFLHWILPPLGPLTELRRQVFKLFSSLMPAHDVLPSVAWVVGYGLAAFLGALVVLERREWAR